MQLHDFIAVGLGPFNLGLACLMEPLEEHRGLFLERAADFSWHPGMLMDRCTLQNPFLADLVSMADPTSRFSYLNYCKLQGRIYDCFVGENFYLSRHEYDRYCRWAASQVRSVRFNHEVTAITHDGARGTYLVCGHDPRTRERFSYAARRLVIGIGASPRLPACCRDADGWIHSGDYLHHKKRLQAGRAITVVGGGQSAAEIFRDLLQDAERHGYELNWVTRSSRFFPMDVAKLTVELLSPDYAQHFFDLPDDVKTRVLEEQRHIYGGINTRLVDAIYDLLNERRETLRGRVRLLPGMTLEGCRRDAAGGGHELEFRHTTLSRRFRHRTDGLVLATGYAPRVPHFVEGIRHRIAWDDEGRYLQQRNFAVDHAGREIFVQNAGCHGHGIASPDLGLACHRNSRLVRELTGVEHYPIETRTTLQDFVPRADGAFVEIAA
jgi:lysine N6-hydroxylase